MHPFLHNLVTPVALSHLQRIEQEGDQGLWEWQDKNWTREEESIPGNIQRIQALTSRCCKHSLNIWLGVKGTHWSEVSSVSSRSRWLSGSPSSLGTAVLALALMLSRSSLPETPTSLPASSFLLPEPGLNKSAGPHPSLAPALSQEATAGVAIL